MMFDSNYNIFVGGVGDGAKAGVANGKKIISKQDSKLKNIGRRKRRATTLDRFSVFGAKSGSKASQMASKMEPISRKKPSKNRLINGYRFLSLREAIFSFV